MIMKLLLDAINTIVIETHGNTTKFEQPAGHGIDQENFMYLAYGSVYNPIPGLFHSPWALGISWYWDQYYLLLLNYITPCFP